MFSERSFVEREGGLGEAERALGGFSFREGSEKRGRQRGLILRRAQDDGFLEVERERALGDGGGGQSEVGLRGWFWSWVSFWARSFDELRMTDFKRVAGASGSAVALPECDGQRPPLPEAEDDGLLEVGLMERSSGAGRVALRGERR
jgi:hypothetical protein